MLTNNDDQLRAIRDHLIARSADLGKAAGAGREQIESALERLEAGVYGICDQCGKQIDTERLRVVPEAVACRLCAAER